MELTKQQLDSLEIPNNYVLVKIPLTYQKMIHWEYDKEVGNAIISVRTDFRVGHHAPRSGIVVKNPRKLIYEQFAPETMEWLTEVETVPGDLIFYDYMESIDALGNILNPAAAGDGDKWIKCEDSVYLFIRYSNIFLVNRKITAVDISRVKMEKGGDIFNGGKINIYKEDEAVPAGVPPIKDIELSFTVNGYVICEPRFNKIKSSLIIPNSLALEAEKSLYKVVYTGKRNKAYFDDSVDAEGVKENDLVYANGFGVKLEGDIENNLPKGLVYFQLKNIYAKK